MFPVESFRSTLEKAVAIFQRHAIRFHLTGGITSVAYGEPRLTQDVDIVVDKKRITHQLATFLESLSKSEFLHNAADVRSAVAAGGMFQLFDKLESLKLDVYPREMIPGELDRSVSFEIFDGLVLPIVSRRTQPPQNSSGSKRAVTRAVATCGNFSEFVPKKNEST